MYLYAPDSADSTSGSPKKKAKAKAKTKLEPLGHEASSPVSKKDWQTMAAKLGRVAIEDRLESSEDDLKLWLEHTGFYDLDYRNKVLVHLRELKALDEKRSQVLASLQSTSGDFPIVGKPLAAPAYLGVSPALAILQKTSLSGSSTGPKTEPDSEASPNFRDSASFDAPEALDDDHLETPAPPCDFTTYNDDQESLISTSESPRPEAQETHAKLDFSAVPRHYLPVPRKYQVPQLQDASKAYKNARYFLIKSFNSLNVEMSQKDGIWVTKRENGQLLTDAFNNSEQVILFYSVNKSKNFQGYARMLTPPNPDLDKASWMMNIHWKTSSPFKVRWINTRDTEFWETNHLHNAFSDDKKVFVGKDGQEISPESGRQLMHIMDNPKQSTKPKGPSTHSEGAKALSWRSRAQAKAAEDVDAVDAVDCADWQPIRLTKPSDAAVEHDPNMEAAQSVDLIEC